MDDEIASFKRYVPVLPTSLPFDRYLATREQLDLFGGGLEYNGHGTIAHDVEDGAIPRFALSRRGHVPWSQP